MARRICTIAAEFPQNLPFARENLRRCRNRRVC